MNPLIGFRAWRYHGDESLRSTMNWRHVWTVGGATAATCLRPPRTLLGGEITIRPHEPPGRECSCGIYARTHLQGVLEEYPLYPRSHAQLAAATGDMCIGAVMMTGEVAWGDRVIRAAEARPLCLCEPGGDTISERQAKLEAIARHNRIPLVPWEHVVAYAGEFGDLARPAPAAARYLPGAAA